MQSNKFTIDKLKVDYVMLGIPFFVKEGEMDHW